jgi:Protein of unknown function (DUF2000)
VDFASVLIVNEQLEPGSVANVAFVLGLSAGRCMPEETFGPTVFDANGGEHHRLTTIGHIVRKASAGKLRGLRAEFLNIPGAIVIDYSEDARTTSYAEYERTLSSRQSDAIVYRAVYVYAPKDSVQALTKSLSRL